MTIATEPKIAKNFSYVLGSQIIVIVTGLIKALVIPLILNIPNYGYWQIYIFYTVYIGLFTLGFNDGIYLRYGGFRFDELPIKKIRSSNWLYVLLLLTGSISVALFSAFNEDPSRQFIFYMVALNVIVLGIVSNISFVLQTTNNMKSYAFLNAADKIFFTVALLAYLVLETQSFVLLLAIDLFSKVLIMLFLLFRYKVLFIGSLDKLKETYCEFMENIRSGGHLLVANLSGMLVLGVGRLILEYFAPLEQYAYYAFSITLSNVALVSVSALSVLVYPILKRLPEENYLQYFDNIDRIYSALFILMLTAYFPAIIFIEFAATNYRPAIPFLNLIFAITALQGKMQLLNNTYYKALRFEKRMLSANLSSLFMVLLLCTAGYVLTQSILVIASATFAAMLYRVYSSEHFLRQRMGGITKFSRKLEIYMLIVFLALTSIFSAWVALPVWLALTAVALLSMRDEIRMFARFVRRG